jgi:hypothetical protein
MLNREFKIFNAENGWIGEMRRMHINIFRAIRGRVKLFSNIIVGLAECVETVIHEGGIEKIALAAGCP